MSALIIPFKDSYLSEVREIFFESSSKKDFKSKEEKEAFFYKYAGFYLEHFPHFVFVALGDKVLGYILGSPNSSDNKLLLLQPHLGTFHKLLVDFPAHLHINCHHDSRGRGIGPLLIERFEMELIELALSGVHIITDINARNKEFYKRQGFLTEVEADFKGARMLFMGKDLRRE